MKMTLIFLGCLALCGCGGSTDDVDTDASTPTASSKNTPPVDVAELNRALLRSITFGEPEQALQAIAQGANVGTKDRYGHPTIFLAARQGNPQVVQAILGAGADPNQTIATNYNTDGVGYAGTVDGTPLTYAAGAGKLDAAMVLVEAGADLNGTGPEGTSALMSAAENGHVEMVKWLLDKGAVEGKASALSRAQMIFNPNEKYLTIIDLLSP